MKQPIPPSEFILNPDGSIYHLNLRQEQVAPTVILVGDPGRVPRVSKHFDKIEHKVQKREFVTHTGWIGQRRLSVLSTGIGTDNIDIVINELDALFNIDPQTRMVRNELTSLNLIRIGTSGALSGEIPIDSMLISSFGIGIDSLLSYYFFEPTEEERDLATSFYDFTKAHGLPVKPIAVRASDSLLEEVGEGMTRGITLSCPGFYGPQGRVMRLSSRIQPSFFDQADAFRFGPHLLGNFEMETSAIYGMARLLGHRAVSCNAIIANRITNEFSDDPKMAVAKLITKVLGELGNG